MQDNFGASGGFDRKKALAELLFSSDIPPKYYEMLTEAVLLLADSPQLSAEEVCEKLAGQTGKSVRFLQINLSRAVQCGWERAVMPNSPLFQKRMRWQDYLIFAVSWLEGKEAAAQRDRQPNRFRLFGDDS